MRVYWRVCGLGMKEEVGNGLALAWLKVNFVHSSWSGAVIWICGGNSVDNTGMFFFLLSLHKAIPPPPSTPPGHRLGVHKELGEGTARAGDPRDIQDLTASCSACRAVGTRRNRTRGTFGVLVFAGVCYPKSRVRALLSWDSWTPACLWEVRNGFLVLLCCVHGSSFTC